MIKNCLHCGIPIESRRNTKKYCSANCKQLAFYKRSGLALSEPGDTVMLVTNNQPTVKKSFDGNQIITQPTHQEELPAQITENLSVKTVNDKQPVMVNSSITLKPEQEETSYEWIHSGIVDSIAILVDESEALSMFESPSKYWGYYTLANVKWVSLRLRCLLENLIRLSNSSAVDCDTIVTAKQAFTDLINANQFKNLPSNYPFITLVKELEQRLAFIVKEHEQHDSMLFRLTVKRKAEIIAARFMLTDFVPWIKFSELKFSE